MRKFFVLIAAACLAGCTASGPVSSPEFRTLVAAAAPAEAGTPEITASATWLPNTIGYTETREFVTGQQLRPITGIAMLGTSGMAFAQWNNPAHRYDIMKLILYANIRQASVDRFGRGARMVLQSKDYTYDTLEFTDSAGILIDVEQTLSAFEFIQKKLDALK